MPAVYPSMREIAAVPLLEFLCFFLMTVGDVVTLLLTVLAAEFLFTAMGVQKGYGGIVSEIANLIVRLLISFKFTEFVNRILHGDGFLPLL